MARRIVFVTSNPGKVREAEAHLAPLGWSVEQRRVPYPEPQADTLDEVARFGAPYVAREVDGPFFLEDSGLFVEALKGFPGVYSAYAMKTIGNEGLLRLLADVPPPRRAARFESRILYRDAGGRDHLFAGRTEGRIADAPRGAKGFGFDPVFVPTEGDGRTFAEFEPAEKNRVSHRGRALRAFAERLSAGTGPKEA